MALDDLLATLERQAGTSGTSGAPADVPAKPAPVLGGTSGTCGTSENEKDEVQAEAFTAWVMHFTDREPLEIWFSPVVSRDEALAAYPEAVAAEPRPDPALVEQSAQESAQKSAASSCKTCRHLAKPGLASGYCGGGRSDLLPAYGPAHPLRRLPDDQGKGCTTWEAVK